MEYAILISLIFGLGMGISEYNDTEDAKRALLAGCAAGLILAAVLIAAVAMGQWIIKAETK